MTAVNSENLLPEPCSAGDVMPIVSSMTNETAPAVVDLKAAEDILLEAEAPGSAYTLPTTTSADLFVGELGEYELNEIPSLFNLDSQQMSADLERLGFSTSAGPETSGEGNEIPFITTSSTTVPATTSSSVNLVSATDSEGESNPSNKKKTTQQKKRSAAEISEDEDSQASKARRVSTTKAASPAAATAKKSRAVAPVTPPASNNKKPLLAPKPSNISSNAAATAAAAAAAAATSATNMTSGGPRKIDTSTAHVKALTGAKGAAMCFEIVSGTELDTTVAIPNIATSADLTPEEKAKFSRDRNRLHARNTRIRKKAYVDELKRTLDVLVKERDNVVAAKTRKIQIEREERDVRYSVLEEFLRLRGSNEQSPTRWSAILEDGVTLHLPNLDGLNKGAAAGTHATKKMVSGVPELMKECNDFTKKMQTGKRGAKKTAGFLNFQCDRSSLLMEGSNVVLDWTATSTDPAKSNLLVRGTCRASFNPHSNKLHAIELFFDSSPLMA